MTLVPAPFLAGMAVARELAAWHAGPEHVLLALVRSPGSAAPLVGPDRAAEAEALCRASQAYPEGAERPDPGVVANPAFHQAEGRAVAFGAALGTGDVDELDTLLALWWDVRLRPRLERWGVSLDAVQAALAAAGRAPLRAGPPPEPEEVTALRRGGGRPAG